MNILSRTIRDNAGLFAALIAIAAVTASDTVAGLLMRNLPHIIANWIGIDMCAIVQAMMCTL